jgi:hypothetical protein
MYPINLWSLGSSISFVDLWEGKYNLREDTLIRIRDSAVFDTDLHEHNQQS